MKTELLIRYVDTRTGYVGFVGEKGKPRAFASQEEAAQFLLDSAEALPTHGDRYAMRYYPIQVWRMPSPAERHAATQAEASETPDQEDMTVAETDAQDENPNWAPKKGRKPKA